MLMLHKPSYRHALLLAVCLVLAVACLPNLAAAEEQQTYVFDRMWPTLKQPWYFSSPSGIAVNGDGDVYVVENTNNRLQRFTSEGVLLGRWGNTGSDNGQFNSPWSVAVDASGDVYVTDSQNNRVQRFSPTGSFISSGVRPAQETANSMACVELP